MPANPYKEPALSPHTELNRAGESEDHRDPANPRCLRPRGMCTLGGSCDVCWYGPNSPRTLELLERQKHS